MDLLWAFVPRHGDSLVAKCHHTFSSPPFPPARAFNFVCSFVCLSLFITQFSLCVDTMASAAGAGAGAGAGGAAAGVEEIDVELYSRQL